MCIRDSVIAIKEASGNITQMDDIIKNKPENFNVISGDDGLTFPLITLGAVGVISVIGNAFPREFSRMTRLADVYKRQVFPMRQEKWCLFHLSPRWRNS